MTKAYIKSYATFGMKFSKINENILDAIIFKWYN
jgi:hypothetical protein